MTAISTVGEMVFHENGESTDAVEGFDLGEFSACLYSYYNYTGDNDYTYELRLWVSDGHEFVVHSGTRIGSDLPDDLYCKDFKLFNFDGAPVVVFGIFFYPDTVPHTVQYGMYFAGGLYMTEKFLNDKGPLAGTWANWNRHDVSNMRADTGLEGYGDVWAFGAYFKKEY
jgi:hypothetical protein